MVISTTLFTIKKKCPLDKDTYSNAGFNCNFDHLVYVRIKNTRGRKIRAATLRLMVILNTSIMPGIKNARGKKIRAATPSLMVISTTSYSPKKGCPWDEDT